MEWGETTTVVVSISAPSGAVVTTVTPTKGGGKPLTLTITATVSITVALHAQPILWMIELAALAVDSRLEVLARNAFGVHQRFFSSA